MLIDNVADMFEVDGERDDLHGAPPILIVEALAGHSGYIELDRLIQAINDVVHARDLGNEPAVVGHQRRHRLSQHVLDDITQVQRFPGCAGQRDGWRMYRRFVKIKGSGRIGAFRWLGQNSDQ